MKIDRILLKFAEIQVLVLKIFFIDFSMIQTIKNGEKKIFKKKNEKNQKKQSKFIDSNHLHQ